MEILKNNLDVEKFIFKKIYYIKNEYWYFKKNS